MPRRSPSRELRNQIAMDAARLMAEQGDLSYAQARAKAAKRLHCTDQRQLPDNRDIELALRAHQQLFQTATRQVELQHLRSSAAQAMRLLEAFQPRLVGPVLSGTASEYSPIRLALFSDTTEAVALALLELKIPWRQQDLLLDYTDKRRVERTIFRFHAGEDQIELLVLPLSDRHNLPLDPIEKRPQKGASLDKVLALLETD